VANDAISAKVWNGATLTSAEFELLAKEAQQSPSPYAKTMLAQALINADQHREAIELLKSTTRDFPHDAQGHLALARAYVSLEQWGQAVAPLERAREILPNDPEPTKVLALVSLRSGEISKAKRLIVHAKEVDPLDGEMKILEAEIDAYGPSRFDAVPSFQHFAQTLVAHLEERGLQSRLDGTHLVTHHTQSHHTQSHAIRVALLPLFQEAQLAPSFEIATRETAAVLWAQTPVVPKGNIRFLKSVLPVLRDARFCEKNHGLVCKRGPADLFVFYVIKDADRFIYVPQAMLRKMRLSVEQLDTAAQGNLAQTPPVVNAVSVQNGIITMGSTDAHLWALASGDGHDAPRLLLESTQHKLSAVLGNMPWRVYLGVTEVTVVCSAANSAAVAQIHNLCANDNGIEGNFQLTPQGLTRISE
jgi:hypothetical protein